MKKGVSLFLPVVLAIFIVSISSCDSPTGSNSQDTKQPSGSYRVNVILRGNEVSDSVTVMPEAAFHGDQITLDYKVIGTKINNLLDFSGVSSIIPVVESAGEGKRTYTLNVVDAVDGVITIFADFTHTNLALDPIEFSTVGPINKVYGDLPFSNSIKANFNGSGSISYSSSNQAVATTDANGLVTIHKAGTTVISAIKAADQDWAPAAAHCFLTIARASPGAPLAPGLNSVSPGTVTIIPPTNANTLFQLEYGYNTTPVVPDTGWQTGLYFGNLDDQSAHYFFARYKANPDKNNVSAASTALFALTDYGDGTVSRPFKVYNIDTLQRVGKGSGEYSAWNLSAFYKLMQDIDMNGQSFTAIGYPTKFAGSFDGNRHTISNIVPTFVSSSYTYPSGLFYYNAGVIKNLGLVNIRITSTGLLALSGGGVVVFNDGLVDNCYVTGSITHSMEYGMMIPLAGTVTVGGIIARNSGTVNHCYAAASIIGNTNRPDIEIVIVGGVVGVNEGVIKNCVALNPSISGTNSNAGRVVGSNSSTLVNNYASNNITMSSSGYVAAIAKDKKDGETITPEQYNNKGWWITPSNWEFSDPWDFANNWKWGANNLPY